MHRDGRSRTTAVLAKRALWWLVPWTAVFLVSSMLAYEFNRALVTASTSPSAPVDEIAEFAATSAYLMLTDTQHDDVLDGCLSRWRDATVGAPDTHAAGLKVFIHTVCGSPLTPAADTTSQQY
jgi:hypothetical protein